MSLESEEFISERLKEFRKNLETRKGTAFHRLFVNPVSLILQPLRDEMNSIKIGQSFRRIVDLPDPNSYSEASVDDLAANVFVYRIQGNKARTIARLYFAEPLSKDYPAGTLIAKSDASLNYVNSDRVIISSSQMGSNIDSDLYYVDVAFEAEKDGEEYNSSTANTLISVNDGDCVLIRNDTAIEGGLNKETNIQLIERAERSIGLRDLNTEKGCISTMFSTFSDRLLGLQSIGFGDKEMLRDIHYNVHVGGKIDLYVKPIHVSEGTFDAISLSVDEARSLPYNIHVTLESVDAYAIGIANINHAVSPIVKSSDTPTKATIIGNVEISQPLNLTNEMIDITVNDTVMANVYLPGVRPSQTNSGEIVARINTALLAAAGAGPSLGKTLSIVMNPIIILRNQGATILDENGADFYDARPMAFKDVVHGDRLRIFHGANAGLYIVDQVISNNRLRVMTSLADITNHATIDETSVRRFFGAKQVNITYQVTRMGKYFKMEAATSLALRGPGVTKLFGFNHAGDTYGGEAYYSVRGRQPRIYQEGVDYEVDYDVGTVTRKLGEQVVALATSGVIARGMYLEDSSGLGLLYNVLPGDLITVVSVGDQIPGQPPPLGAPNYYFTAVGDYRVEEVLSDSMVRTDRMLLDVNQPTALNCAYYVRRTGIKDKETVQVTVEYHPISVDIGNQVPLDEAGWVRGIRPGREPYTIPGLAFLDVTGIQRIDPATRESAGYALSDKSGFGAGGFGESGFGMGGAADYWLDVLEPNHRYSSYENSAIIFDPMFQGDSVQISYRYAPDIRTFHEFCTRGKERVIDADILVRHYIPAFVSMELSYSPDPRNPYNATAAEITEAVKHFINRLPAGTPLDASDIIGVIKNILDPSATGRARVRTPIEMLATIHDIDGTERTINSQDRLIVPTVGYLTPRTVRWIADIISVVEE